MSGLGFIPNTSPPLLLLPIVTDVVFSLGLFVWNVTFNGRAYALPMDVTLSGHVLLVHVGVCRTQKQATTKSVALVNFISGEWLPLHIGFMGVEAFCPICPLSIVDQTWDFTLWLIWSSLVGVYLDSLKLLTWRTIRSQYNPSDVSSWTALDCFLGTEAYISYIHTETLTYILCLFIKHLLNPHNSSMRIM